MTHEEKVKLLQLLCDEITARPLDFPITMRRGTVLPAPSAQVLFPDFTKRARVRRPDPSALCQVHHLYPPIESEPT